MGTDGRVNILHHQPERRPPGPDQWFEDGSRGTIYSIICTEGNPRLGQNAPLFGPYLGSVNCAKVGTDKDS